MRRSAPIENYSGFSVGSEKIVPPARKGFIIFDDQQSVGGDAPKDFIRVYDYGEARKRNRAAWPAYIAKVGHKWYPIESITEHLLTRIGEALRLRMAQSRLMRIDGQIRFLSRYFLEPNESLEHGAQIFSGYLEDEKFVEEVDGNRLSREYFTFEFVCEAVMSGYEDHSQHILVDFVRMLGFDAIVGNNDRHFYNWGVVVHALGKRPPQFAPIYDSARALFWNEHEDRLARFSGKKLDKYIEGSKPQIGWEDTPPANHFDLIERITSDYPEFVPPLSELCDTSVLQRVEEVLSTEFKPLMSITRRTLVMECLIKRYRRFCGIFCS